MKFLILASIILFSAIGVQESFGTSPCMTVTEEFLVPRTKNIIIAKPITMIESKSYENFYHVYYQNLENLKGNIPNYFEMSEKIFYDNKDGTIKKDMKKQILFLNNENNQYVGSEYCGWKFDLESLPKILDLIEEQKSILTPYDQQKEGVSIQDMICRSPNLIKIININGKYSCITYNSFSTLLERNWLSKENFMIKVFTEKTEYEIGEKINIFVENNGLFPITIETNTGIQIWDTNGNLLTKYQGKISEKIEPDQKKHIFVWDQFPMNLEGICWREFDRDDGTHVTVLICNNNEYNDNFVQEANELVKYRTYYFTNDELSIRLGTNFSSGDYILQIKYYIDYPVDDTYRTNYAFTILE